MSVSESPIRRRTRTVVRSMLARTALDLFVTRGYNATTIEDVAGAAGVSRRTLFNYFRNKEDLALSGLDEEGEMIAARLAERPVEEDCWVSLRTAFRALDDIEITPERRLELSKLLFENESLRAGHAEKQARWEDLLAPMIEPRLPESDSRSLQARAITAAAIGCLRLASVEWMRSGGQHDWAHLYDIAVGAIRDAV
jgi:AcrR family transcriptional regulator